MHPTEGLISIRNVSRPARSILAMVLLALLWIIATAPASAQRDYMSCGHFETQADAQAVLDAGNLDENGVQSLDNDADGIACEDAFETTEGAPPAYDSVSCGHFETQADAQEVLDGGTLDDLGVQSLDGDGNGIACETAFGEPAAPEPAAPATTVVSLPNTGTGPTAAPGGSALAAIALLIGAGAAITCGAMLRQGARR
jgi:hypothetical protein